MVAHKFVKTAINAKSGSERHSKHLSQFYIRFLRWVGDEQEAVGEWRWQMATVQKKLHLIEMKLLEYTLRDSNPGPTD